MCPRRGCHLPSAGPAPPLWAGPAGPGLTARGPTPEGVGAPSPHPPSSYTSFHLCRGRLRCDSSSSSAYALVRHWYFLPTIRSTVCVLIFICIAVFLRFAPLSTCDIARSRRFLPVCGVAGKYCTSLRTRFVLGPRLPVKCCCAVNDPVLPVGSALLLSALRHLPPLAAPVPWVSPPPCSYVCCLRARCCCRAARHVLCVRCVSAFLLRFLCRWRLAAATLLC